MRHAPLLSLLAASLSLATPWQPVNAQSCTARSGAQRATVVELYTSEGCSSCPPADRWMSSLKMGPDLVALAFHVDYWDRLGWADRFASATYTRRQAAQQSVNGARYSYTPQVVIDGSDRKDWASLRALPASAGTSPVEIVLSRDGDIVNASVQARTALRLAAYWAVTESGHATAVKAGENNGATLQHDHVVRELLPVKAWAAAAGATTRMQFRPTTPADAAHPRQISFVIVDADTGKPVQALSLGC
ncbi:MAG: DUF1223 domain-containing protein [Rhizobacter sp.]|nr:DUF1223 domain-containing protein [Rhizobacter sp.]